MAILGVDQPESIEINQALRLRRYDGTADFAFAWYQDEALVYLVDGVKKPYSWETLRGMYAYLDAHGELYFIETLEDGAFVPIGDVTFWREDMPIVIGNPAYRGRGIGRQVIMALMDLGRQLGYDRLGVREIYDFNEASIRCFTACGFLPVERTEKGWRYEAKL
jgi:RimJ/RimL family protein N-acetyltransferase